MPSQRFSQPVPTLKADERIYIVRFRNNFLQNSLSGTLPNMTYTLRWFLIIYDQTDQSISRKSNLPDHQNRLNLITYTFYFLKMVTGRTGCQLLAPEICCIISMFLVRVKYPVPRTSILIFSPKIKDFLDCVLRFP